MSTLMKYPTGLPVASDGFTGRPIGFPANNSIESGNAVEFYSQLPKSFSPVPLYPPNLLLPMNSNFNDISNTPHTITEVNTPTIDNTNFALGTGSGNFDRASSQHLTVPDHDDFTVGDDYTWEWWMRFASVGQTAYTIFNKYEGADTANRSFIVDWRSGTEKLRFILATGVGVNQMIEGDFLPVVDTWYSGMAVKNGLDLHLYVDDTRVGSGSLTGGSTVIDSTDPIYIAATDAAINEFDGELDEIILTKDVAKETGATRTVPTSEINADGSYS